MHAVTAVDVKIGVGFAVTRPIRNVPLWSEVAALDDADERWDHEERQSTEQSTQRHTDCSVRQRRAALRLHSNGFLEFDSPSLGTSRHGERPEPRVLAASVGFNSGRTDGRMTSSRRGNHLVQNVSSPQQFVDAAVNPSPFRDELGGQPWCR